MAAQRNKVVAGKRYVKDVNSASFNNLQVQKKADTLIANRRVASQFFLVSPWGHFVCPVSSFSELKEI